MTKTRISKKDFHSRVVWLKELAESTLAATQKIVAHAENVGAYADIAEHDPQLSKLLVEVDSAAIEPLTRLLRYVKSRVES